MKFKNEIEAIKRVELNVPIAVKPIRKSKYKYIDPFTSVNSRKLTCECLGKELYKLLLK